VATNWIQAWRPQRDSKGRISPNQRRNPSTKHAKTTTCTRGQTMRVDGRRQVSTTVRGQFGDSGDVSIPHAALLHRHMMMPPRRLSAYLRHDRRITRTGSA
jgi:hypothetical protein